VSRKSFRAAALDIVATALDLEADDLSSQGGQLEKIKTSWPIFQTPN